MNVLSQIVVASPDMESRRTLANILARLGLDPICTATVSECRVMLTKENVALVFCDRDLADGDYRDILAVSRATKRQPGVVLTGEHGTCEEYHEAIGLGVFGVTVMPYQPTDVEWMVIQARRYERKRTPEAEADDHLWETEAINWAHTVATAGMVSHRAMRMMKEDAKDEVKEPSPVTRIKTCIPKKQVA